MSACGLGAAPQRDSCAFHPSMLPASMPGDIHETPAYPGRSFRIRTCRLHPRPRPSPRQRRLLRPGSADSASIAAGKQVYDTICSAWPQWRR